MSVECSECERDLRGGHAENCSRNLGPPCTCDHPQKRHYHRRHDAPTRGFCTQCLCREFEKAEDE